MSCTKAGIGVGALLCPMLVCLVLVCLMPAAEAAEKAGPSHKNEAWGFKVRVPSKWNIVHMDTKEQWIAMKAIGPRELYGDKGAGWGERPEMWIVAFPHERQRQRGAKREKIDESTTKITVQNPYKDFKDFVKREKRLSLGEAGFYFSKEEETEHAGMSVSIYEVMAEKMVEVPKQMVAWVYHTEDVDYAVQFRIQRHHFGDYKNTFKTCLKSFRTIPRTKPMPGTSSTGKKIVDVEGEKNLTPEERKAKRILAVENYLKDEIANLPKDWTHKDSDHFCVMSHADRKFTHRVSKHAECVRAYLEKTFPGLGDDHVPRGIIRIFKDNAEENAFRNGTSSIWFDDVEQILIAADKGWSLLWEYERVSRDVTRQWLWYKNRNLYETMPWWLQSGLTDHMEQARPSKRRALVFAPDRNDVLTLVRMVREDKLKPIKELFLSEAAEDRHVDDQGGFTVTFISPTSQATAVFHYLMTKGNRGPLKGALQTYLETLVQVIDEEDKRFEKEELERLRKQMDDERKRAEDGSGDDDEDEDEDKKRQEEWKKAMKEYDERLRAKAQAIREQAYAAAFGHMTDKQWKRVDKAFKTYAEKGGR